MHIQDRAGLPERIQSVRQHLGLTQTEFANDLNISQAHISKMIKGKSGLSRAVLELINLKYKVNKTWILTGEGNMFESTDVENNLVLELGKNIYRFDSLDKKILLEFIRLSENERKAVKSFLQTLSLADLTKCLTIRDRL